MAESPPSVSIPLKTEKKRVQLLLYLAFKSETGPCSVNQNVRGYSENNSNSVSFSCDSFPRRVVNVPNYILKQSFGTTKMPAYGINFMYACLQPKLWECLLRWYYLFYSKKS